MLTGDAELKEIAKKEQVQVNGTIWLLCTMIEHGIITKMDARTALKLMEEAGRRLPWKLAEQMVLGCKPLTQMHIRFTSPTSGSHTSRSATDKRTGI